MPNISHSGVLKTGLAMMLSFQEKTGGSLWHGSQPSVDFSKQPRIRHLGLLDHTGVQWMLLLAGSDQEGFRIRPEALASD
jgi:hypothetical protein